MKSVSPYINFNGNCEEAFKFYQSVFGGELHITRYKDLENKMGLEGDGLNKIANVSLPLINGMQLYGSDTPDTENFGVKAGDHIQINLETESAEEAEHIFKGLSKDGEIKMPLNKTEWAESFGMIADKYNVQWMVMYSGETNL